MANKINIANVPEVATISQLLGVDANSKWAKIAGSSFATPSYVQTALQRGDERTLSLDTSNYKTVRYNHEVFWVSGNKISVSNPLVFNIAADAPENKVDDSSTRAYYAHCIISNQRTESFMVRMSNTSYGYSREYTITGLTIGAYYYLTLIFIANKTVFEARGIINQLAIP